MIKRLGLGLRMVIDGSYTTDKAEPDDIDIAMLSSGLDETDTLQHLRDEMVNLDLLDVFVDVTEVGFEKMADFFAHDRAGDPKGVILLVV